MSNIYCVVVEHKMEKPIIIESILLTLEEATNIAKDFAKRIDVIRVAVFQLSYESGNETLDRNGAFEL